MTNPVSVLFYSNHAVVKFRDLYQFQYIWSCATSLNRNAKDFSPLILMQKILLNKAPVDDLNTFPT